MLRMDNQLLGRGMSLIAGLEQTRELLCEANEAALHYVLDSFVLSHSIRP